MTVRTQRWTWWVSEVGASLLHFVRLSAREDLDLLKRQAEEVGDRARRLTEWVDRLENQRSTTSERPSRGPGRS